MTNNNTLYKNTKVGTIPKEWEVVKLGEIFEFLKTSSHSRAKLTVEEVQNPIYNIHYGDIHSKYKGTFIDFDKESEIPKLIDNQSISNRISFLQEGDLIIADASEDYEGIGAAMELKNVKGKLVTGGLHTFAIRDIKNKTVNGYRNYIFHSYEVSKSLKKIATGISVLGISKSNLSKILLPIPPLPEQQKIANILTTWDTAIEKTSALITQLQQRKKGLMQQLLTGKMRLKGFSEKWEEVKLGEYCDLITKGTTPTSLGFPFTKKGVNFFKIECISDNGNVISKKFQFIDKRTHEKLKRSKLRENDILFSIAGALGRVTIVNKVHLPANTNQALGIIRLNKNSKLKLTFLYYFLKSPRISKEIAIINVQAAQANLSLKNLNNFKILVPEAEEQTAIAKVLTAADEEISKYEQQLSALQAQKRGLMQVLLTGKVRVAAE